MPKQLEITQKKNIYHFLAIRNNYHKLHITHHVIMHHNIRALYGCPDVRTFSFFSCFLAFLSGQCPKCPLFVRTMSGKCPDTVRTLSRHFSIFEQISSYFCFKKNHLTWRCQMNFWRKFFLESLRLTADTIV